MEQQTAERTNTLSFHPNKASSEMSRSGSQTQQDKRRASVNSKTTWLRDAHLGGIRRKTQGTVIMEVGTFGGGLNWGTDNIC